MPEISELITVENKETEATETAENEAVSAGIQAPETETEEAKTRIEPETTELKKNDEYLGSFRITVYTPYSDGGKWGYQTATGKTSTHLATCAVDPDVILLGSTLWVGGLELKAVDTGSAVKGNVIDIFFDGTDEESHAWIAEFGTTHDVWEVVEE